MFMPMVQGGISLAGGHIIEGSGLFADGLGNYLSRTVISASNRKTFTYSVVFKRASHSRTWLMGQANVAGSSGFCGLEITATSAIGLYYHDGSTAGGHLVSTQLLRDSSAYYHIVAHFDTTNGTAGDRMKMWLNGTEITDFSTDIQPTLNLQTEQNNTTHPMGVGSIGQFNGAQMDGYIARAILIDGQALDPTSFGEVTDDGFWSILDASGLDFTGTNSFLIEGGVDMAAGIDSSQGAVVSDPRFLSHLDGSDAATSATDVSAFERTMTFVGNAQLDTAQKKFGTASLLLDGSGDRVTMPDSESLEIGGGDFTMDGWMRFASTSASSALFTKYLTTGNQRSFQFLWHTSSGLTLDMSANGTSSLTSVTNAWSPSTNTWYHVAVERTGGKIYMYVDGTMLGSGTANTTNIFNGTALLSLGATIIPSSQLNGYIDEPRIIIGVGMYGGSNFSVETSAYADPTTGLGNHFVRSGSIISTSDSATNGGDDNEYGNYATWNVNLPATYEAYTPTYSEGNLRMKSGITQSTLTIAAGELVYWEIECIAGTSGASVYGITDQDGKTGAGNSQARMLRIQSGEKWSSDAPTWTAYGVSWTAGDIVQFAVDRINGSIYVGKNNTWMNSGDPTSGSSKTGAMFTDLETADINGDWRPSVFCSSTSNEVRADFGQNGLTYAIPTGYKTLATQNLPTPAVINYEDEYYIEAGISHSNGSTTAVTLPKTVSGGAMVRLKRTDSTGGWYVFDTVRGANKFQFWNDTAVEDTSTFSDQNLTGSTFTIPSGMASGSYLLECFFVGSYFQIDSYTGNGANRTLSFDSTLDTAPGFMVFHDRVDNGMEKLAYHESLGNGKFLQCEAAAAAGTSATFLNSTSPTTTTFRLGTMDNVNKNTSTYIMYAWANSGPYLFGNYTGNGATDGPFINVGGSPKTMWHKITAGAVNDWLMFSSEWSDNVIDEYINPNATTGFSTHTAKKEDIVSNGAKIVGSNATFNTSSGAYIYMAFGIQPLTDGAINQGRAK